jgi:DNA gyrase subunit A
VKAMNVTEKTGSLVAIKEVVDSDDLMIINKSGITIRTPVADLRVMGRATQGVRLIKLNENDEISSIEKIEKIEIEEIMDATDIVDPDMETTEGADNDQDDNSTDENQTDKPNNLE